MHLPLIYRASALCSPKPAALRGCIGTQTHFILQECTVEMHKTFAQQAVSGPAYADAPGTNAYRRCPWRSRRSTAARARGARRSAQAGAQAPGCRSARSSCSARSAGREILRGCRPSARRAPARGPHRHTRTARASPGVPPLCSGASVSSVSSASSVLIPVAQTGTGEGTPRIAAGLHPSEKWAYFLRRQCHHVPVSAPPACLRIRVSAPPPAACRCLHSAVSFGCCGFAGGKTGLSGGVTGAGQWGRCMAGCAWRF